jgi:hypothetical protein
VPHEVHEHIEHAGHAGGGKLSQWIGITVAILGVSMALCSAQVGAARTDLIKVMVEENAAKTSYLSVSNKYRALQAQLQALHALMPDPEVRAEKKARLKALMADVKNPDTMQGIEAAELQTAMILNTVTPTKTDVMRILTLLDRMREETKAAKEWSEAYEGAIQAHSDTADRFEIALVAAEIGIVLASVALLLVKRIMFAGTAWSLSIALGVICLVLGIRTKVLNTEALHHAEKEIAATAKHYQSMNRDEKDVADDLKLESDIRRDIEKLTAGF